MSPGGGRGLEPVLDWGNLLGSGGHFFAFRSLVYRDMLQILSFQPLRGTLSTRVPINHNLKALSTSVFWASCLSLQLKVNGCLYTSLSVEQDNTHRSANTQVETSTTHSTPDTKSPAHKRQLKHKGPGYRIFHLQNS